MAEIVWTEPALSDLAAIAEYIALDKPDAAKDLVRRIMSRVDMLSSHPEMGSRIRELLPNSRYRHLVERPCRLFYRYDQESEKCYVLGVMRGERLFQKCLLNRRDKGSTSGS